MVFFLEPIDGQTSTAKTEASISGNGSAISGRAAPASSVVVITTDGTQLASGTTGADGNFILRLGSSQTNGEQLFVTITPHNGGKAETMELHAPDFTGLRPVEDVSITSDGIFVYGTGAVAGQPVRVMNGGTINSQSLRVFAFDAMGNPSEPVMFTCPDYTIPTAEGVRISGDGKFIEGQTEPFARVAVSSEPDPFSSDVFLATVNEGYADAQGRFFMELKKPAIDGESIYVAVADQAKNCSNDIRLDAPDLQQPGTPQTTVIDSQSGVISGLGEPGTVAIVTDSSGQIIAHAPVEKNGTFEIGLELQAFAKGGVIEVSLVDEAGNISAATTIEYSGVDAAPTENASGAVAAPVQEVALADAAPQFEAPVAPVAEAQTAAVAASTAAVEPTPTDEAVALAETVRNEPAPQPSPVVTAEAPAPVVVAVGPDADAPSVPPAAALVEEPAVQAAPAAAAPDIEAAAPAEPVRDETAAQPSSAVIAEVTPPSDTQEAVPTEAGQSADGSAASTEPASVPTPANDEATQPAVPEAAATAKPQEPIAEAPAPVEAAVEPDAEAPPAPPAATVGVQATNDVAAPVVEPATQAAPETSTPVPEAPVPAPATAPVDAPQTEEVEAPAVTPAASTINEPVAEADAATISVKKRAVELPSEEESALTECIPLMELSPEHDEENDTQGETLFVVYSDTPCEDDGEGDFLFTQEPVFDTIAGRWDHAMLARLTSLMDEFEARNEVEMFYI